jgi:hypothetical protein
VPHAPLDAHLIRTYLEWLADLPWSVETTDKLDLREARAVLDADHYDLEKVKDASSSTWPCASSRPARRPDPLLRRSARRRQTSRR